MQLVGVEFSEVSLVVVFVQDIQLIAFIIKLVNSLLIIIKVGYISFSNNILYYSLQSVGVSYGFVSSCHEPFELV